MKTACNAYAADFASPMTNGLYCTLTITHTEQIGALLMSYEGDACHDSYVEFFDGDYVAADNFIQHFVPEGPIDPVVNPMLTGRGAITIQLYTGHSCAGDFILPLEFSPGKPPAGSETPLFLVSPECSTELALEDEPGEDAYDIYSPGYRANYEYPGLMHCQIQIYSEFDDFFLVVKDFDMERNQDIVEVRDPLLVMMACNDVFHV
jgi:hypothetical protein